jgi:hypothetical protein
LQHFLELCDTIIIKDVTPASIRLRLLPFSLAGKAKQWFYKDKEAINTWDKCSTTFLAKIFPMGKTHAMRRKTSKPLCQEMHDHLIDPPFITKNEDPNRLTITCSIGPHVFHNVFYDLRASINIMSRVIYDKILGGPLFATHFQLQMADQSPRNLEGVANDILVKIQDTYIPTDFVILDMDHNKKDPLLLGTPFLTLQMQFYT